MKKLDKNSLKKVVGGMKWTDERGDNVENRTCGRKYGLPPCN
ncbi:hypothetical protein [Elizabethkingia ursingii]|nr:hypothetical protein [Elizabethkingia ursingii]